MQLLLQTIFIYFLHMTWQGEGRGWGWGWGSVHLRGPSLAARTGQVLLQDLLLQQPGVGGGYHHRRLLRQTPSPTQSGSQGAVRLLFRFFRPVIRLLGGSAPGEDLRCHVLGP